jgi:hypothetical protein
MLVLLDWNKSNNIKGRNTYKISIGKPFGKRLLIIDLTRRICDDNEKDLR